jgi:hypothetical protein
VVCLQVGMAILLACDFRFASPNAHFEAMCAPQPAPLQPTPHRSAEWNVHVDMSMNNG